MKVELNEKLFQAFPDLFMARYGSQPKQRGTWWGLQCYDGWYELIESIAVLLTRHNSKIQAEQVKEKFAGLRFYYRPADSYTEGVVAMAETLSVQICEDCGSPGLIWNRDGCFVTWCEQHKVPPCQPASKDWLADSSPLAGIGPGWSRLIVGLQKSLAKESEQRRMPPVKLRIEKDDGLLHVTFSGGNETVRGMVDLINHYAGKLDEQSGCLLKTPS
jgi:hypothetical protein